MDTPGKDIIGILCFGLLDDRDRNENCSLTGASMRYYRRYWLGPRETILQLPGSGTTSADTVDLNTDDKTGKCNIDCCIALLARRGAEMRIKVQSMGDDIFHGERLSASKGDVFLANELNATNRIAAFLKLSFRKR